MKLFSNIKGDLSGGLNAAIVALPIALAFGGSAGLSPINGLYGAIFLGIIAALFGGTSTLISNPTGPMTVVAAIIITNQTQIHGNSILQALPYIITIFFLAGLIQVIFGLLKLGKYVAYIPYPVISGFMSGIGSIIIILQISDFFGLYQKFSVIGTFENIDYIISMANWTNVGLAISTIAIVYLFPYITKKVPSTLIALIAVSLIAFIFELDVIVVGDKAQIPSELPKLRLEILSNFQFSQFLGLLPAAISLAGLGMIDSLLTSVVADKLTKTKHNSNLELIGQGVGNMISSLFLGLPGAGTTPATVLNINSGAKTKLSGISHGIFLFIILMVGGSIAEKIPFAVLSGILITVGVSVFDHNVIKHIKYIPKNDNFIMILVLILTVFWDLLFAVAIGLILASLYFMKKMADIVESESTHNIRNKTINAIIDSFDDSKMFRKKVSVMSLNGPMFFGFASRFENKILKIPENIKAVLFDFSNVLYMDQSGAYTFKDAIQTLHDRNITIVISDVGKTKMDLLQGIGVVPDLIDKKHIFETEERAIHWLNQPGHIENSFKHDEELYIPSAFSPNNDGIDDCWEIKNIHKYPKCNLMVYTKTNIMVFEQIGGYNQPWDGKNLRGKEVPNGKYIYELDLYGDKSEMKIGTISIIR